MCTNQREEFEFKTCTLIRWHDSRYCNQELQELAEMRYWGWKERSCMKEVMGEVVEEEAYLFATCT